MYEYPEEQEDGLAGASGAGQSRLRQYLSEVGSPARGYRDAAMQLQPHQSGGSWITGRTQSPSSNLPPPPKPPGVPNGAVLSPQYDLVRAQDAARRDPKNQPIKHGDTYCNIATYQIAQAMGAPMEPFTTQVSVSKMYPKGTRPAMANEMADKLAHSKDYRVITAEEAQALANQGKLVVAVQPDGKHGHVATVRPDNLYSETAPTAGSGPVMNNIGRAVGIRRAGGAKPEERAFLPGTEPIYYTPANSK